MQLRAVLRRSRFNLSILECKLRTGLTCRRVGRVLIYPYWNVNESTYQRFNNLSSVLIYPYWNVNKMLTPDLMFSLVVLIYPYWNVSLHYFLEIEVIPNG